MLKQLLKKFETSVIPRQLQVALRSRLYRNDLQKLCFMHQSDKFGRHFYTDHYQRHFWELRRLPLKVLEIGVGGYDAQTLVARHCECGEISSPTQELQELTFTINPA